MFQLNEIKLIGVKCLIKQTILDFDWTSVWVGCLKEAFASDSVLAGAW